MSQMVWTFPGGKLEQSVTSITLVNATEKTQDTTVPTGKQWLLLWISLTNIDDVTRDTFIDLYKEAGKTNKLTRLTYKTAMDANGAVRYAIPSAGKTTVSGDSLDMAFPLILAAGNTISVTWASGGASTGATDADGLVICYLEIDA